MFFKNSSPKKETEIKKDTEGKEGEDKGEGETEREPCERWVALSILLVYGRFNIMAA